MPISFGCSCGKRLKAKDEHAGRRTKCPGCEAVLTVPTPEIDPDLGDGLPYDLEPPAPSPGIRTRFEPAPLDPSGESVFHAWTDPSRPVGRPSPSVREQEELFTLESATPSMREYVYCFLVLTLIPLMVSLLDREAFNIESKLEQTFAKASPDQQAKMIALQSDEGLEINKLLAVAPEGRLHGAHLSYDSQLHWLYGLVSALVFLGFLAVMFHRESVSVLKLAGVGLFTGTVGIVLLLICQFCASFRLGGRIFGGKAFLIFLILFFIGWSYRSAEDPSSSFWLSAFGFTFGVGLCEEICKAVPIIAMYRSGTKPGWRGACLLGLASGVGFGVSEGIMYSGGTYNGILGLDIYFVRFVSCVALHAMWSGAVGVTIDRKREFVEQADDLGSFGLTALQVVAVPMILHGFYDTLLKKDMNEMALVVALMSFGWFAFQIEKARSFDDQRNREASRRAFA